VAIPSEPERPISELFADFVESVQVPAKSLYHFNNQPISFEETARLGMTFSDSIVYADY
jgi:hypothetical protein